MIVEFRTRRSLCWYSCAKPILFNCYGIDLSDTSYSVNAPRRQETIEANYRQVKQEVLPLADFETARIKADPTLSHLIKE